MNCRLDYIIVVFLFTINLSTRHKSHNTKSYRNGFQFTLGISSSAAAAAADDDAEAEKKYRAIFVSDIKGLLEHNRRFYNTYGEQDGDVDLAFDEAKLAADVIFLYPQFFREKISEINYRIEQALKKKKEKDKEKEKEAFVTADGVPVYFIDKNFLLIGALGGMRMIRFPFD